MKPTKTYLKDLVYHVNGAVIEVHKHFGPGLLENVYQKCLEKELSIRDFSFQAERIIPVDYKGISVETNLRCDLIVEHSLIGALKAIEKVLPIHEVQLLTYMRLLHIPIGLIINFNVTNIFREEQKTYVNELYTTLEE